ncbi:glycosyl hydrolase family 8 [Clostridium sp. Ade.TY]|uniref:glycosyl hydrolase family 8 n=1 Tax=Clostridium sp. Ade.TY TaxID=1391647 RepID=UPI000420C081|nr:glycosyl hydrolase family 8 [Clostridium sp. Ade.TY]
MDNQNKDIYGIVFLSLLILLIFIKVAMPYVLPVDSNVKYSDNPVSERENILLKFVDNKLTNNSGGIKTNYINKKSEGDITKGNAVLSESEGMMLIYYLERNDKENFNKVLNCIENNMILKDNLVSWRVYGDDKNQTSATIDDLRIVKALLLANERWGDFHYRKLAIKISRAINEKLIDVDVLSDFYDGYNKSDITTLCYIDVPTLDYLSNIDYKWKKVYSASVKLLNDGYISDYLPLYRTNYNRKTKKYDNENTVDTLLSLICILNKLDAKQSVANSIQWIEGKFSKDGAMYSKYNVKNGEKDSNIESTSIYALLVKIGYDSGNKELYNMALKKLESFQVLDKNSELYGAYGDTKTLSVYSFDNLNALLAYRDVK